MSFSTSVEFKKRGFRQKDIEKALIYETILQNQTTRKRLCRQLRIRPNNITESVQELMEEGLIYEDSFIKNTRQGRPEILLKPCPDKLVAVSIWVESTRLNGAILNINGDKIDSSFREIPADADNTAFLDNLYGLMNTLLIKTKSKQSIIGIGLALPGVVAAHSTKWIFNSRWPNVKNLDLSKLSIRYSLPIYICRMLDAQLVALISQETQLADQSVYLIHWGYGIGASFAINGTVLTSSMGSACEIGHVKLNNASSLTCRCKEKGCLETKAAGWAIIPALERQYGAFPNNEAGASKKIKELDIADNPIIKEAIKSIAGVADAMYRINYPDKMIFYGPFIFNDGTRNALANQIMQSIPEYARTSLEIQFITDDLSELSPKGSTIAFFRNKLQEMLIAK